MTRRCKQCDAEFEPRNDRQQFCVGKACRQTWHREQKEKATVVIDKDHPFPVGMNSRYAFIHAMEPKTDSVYIECENDRHRKKNERNRAYDYAKLHGLSIITRSEKTGFRLWVRYDPEIHS